MPNARFSIIIPSYNGGDYLKTCVRNIQVQTHSNWNLAILDDGSTDGTLEWLQSLNDKRVTIYPSAHLGIEKNWDRARTVPRGEWMTILGQDDWLDSNYLSVMDSLTRKFPDAALFHAHFRFVDAAGETLRACRPLPERETAGEYVRELFGGRRDTYGTGYLMRSSDYDSLGGIAMFPKLLFADDALWISLMQRGEKATAAENCFACRSHAASVSAGGSWRFWMQAMTPYAHFLRDACAADPKLSQAVAAEARGYFLHYARVKYAEALVEATRKGKRLDKTLFDDAAQALEPMIPGFGREIGATKNLRLREFVNKTAAGRAGYNALIRLRHGAN